MYARLGGTTNDPSMSINLQQGLMGWWKFDGNLKDSTPYQRDGVLTGATYGTDRKGASNKAVTLNGTNQIVSAGSPGVSSAFSYTGWFKMNSWGTTWGSVFGDFSHAAPPNGINFVPRSGQVIMCIGDNTGTYSAATTCNPNLMSASDVKLNTWIHGALVYDGTTLKVFINGQNIGTRTKAITHNNTTFTMGRWASSYNTDYYVDGSIDDVRIYNRALSDNEVTALYQEYDAQVNAGSGEKGLLGWWKLDGNGKDATPYQNNGVFTAGAAIADREGSTGGAYSFNALGSKMVLPNPVGQSGQMTASVWYRRTEASSSGTWRTILGHKTANIHQLILNNTSRHLGIWDGAFRDFGYTAPNDGAWHNFTVIYDSAGTAKLYVDGGFISQVTTTLNLAANPIGTIGNWNSGSYWAGDIDDVRIYNRALSDVEIQQRYTSYNSQINLNSTPNSTTPNINSGLVGYWPFTGNAKDATPYAHNGTVTDATLTTDRKGNANSAYLFNGTSSNITAGLVSAITKAGNYTVSVWVKSTNTGASQTIFQNAANCNDRNSLAVNGTGVYFYYYNGTAYISKAGTMNNGQWNHIVGINTGGTLSLYVNGVAQSGTGNAYVHCQVGLWLGSTSAIPGTPQWYSGSIDEFRVWNRALSAAEVQALYTQ